MNLLSFSHSTTCSVVSSYFWHYGHLVSVLPILWLQFICHICSFFLITSFIASLSHYCKYFFFSHLWSAIILAFVLFIISCFVLSCILTFLFFLSPTYSIRICSRFPHFLFSLLFVGLYVILLRSWCSCGFSLFVLLIFFLLFFYGHYTSCYGKASLLYCTVILYCILWLAGYVTVSPS